MDGEPVELVLPAGDTVAVDTVAALVVDLAHILDRLVALRNDARATPSLTAWSHVARLAVESIARGHLEPQISPAGHDEWRVLPLDDRERRVRAELASWLPPEAICAPVDAADPGTDPRIIEPVVAVNAFYDAIADALPRTAAAPTLSGQHPWAVPMAVDVTRLRPHIPEAEQQRDTIVRLLLSLPEAEDDPFVVDLSVRSASDPTRTAEAADLWAGRADGFDARAEADVLVALRRGARLWPPLGRLLDQSHPARLELADPEATELFGATATRLAEVGVEVLIPAELTKVLRATPHVSTPPPGAGDNPSHFDLNSVCQLTWRATLDGEIVDDVELSRLAETRRPLVKLRGHWVVVDPTVVAQLSRREQITGAQALAVALGAGIDDEVDDAGFAPVQPDVAPVVDGSVLDLVTRLRSAQGPHEQAEPDGLVAELRPYQRRGLAWLTEMCDLGLGGILADDMGLGKTVQLIALHVSRLETPDIADLPTLVVCPASLVGNWQREIAKFAPGVTVHRYHGPERDTSAVRPGEIVVTTYGIVRRDAENLASTRWGLVVADEAQQIKNPLSASARAMRKIPASARIAMTGTPVENRLTELWALLDWTSPGLLGPVDHFRRDVAIPIERDGDADTTRRFARLVAPFMLRRRKTDPDIAPDLPPKTETDHPVVLTPEQAGLYRAVVEEILEQIEKADGFSRRGLVLKLLTALKQICNHPAHYLGQPGPLAGRSGKLDVFDELITAITDAGDSTLVFTQFVTMGHLLMTRLGELGIAAEFLHGSDSLTRRADRVDRFQAGEFPVLVVSLRAGGTGLNLTRATHVIHYDRWWNPAVENQASDRAWRIGQDRPVQIHRLISEGTIEDRIAQVLQQKQNLAASVIGGGEAWIGELTNDELSDLVRLGAS